MFRPTYWLAILMAAPVLLTAASSGKLNYPVPPSSNQVDDYHGSKVADPYRILENADAPATQKFVEQENELTFSWLGKIPGREALRARLTALWNYEKYTGLYKAGGRYFQLHNTGLQNQSVLYVLDSLNAKPRELLDPNTYRKDGTAAMTAEVVSWNGKLLAYSIAQAGSDWDEWRVRDIDTGKDLPDLVRWSKGVSISWAPDDKGFYYCRFPEPPPDKLLTAAALNNKVYFHKLGDPQSTDRLVYERPDHPDWSFAPFVMEGSHALIIYVDVGIPGKNALAWQDLSSPNPKTIDLITAADYGYDPVAVVGSTLYLQTTDHAQRGRVVTLDMNHPQRANWKEIVPERAETLDGAQLVGGRLIVGYMKDAHSIARILTADGKQISEVEMPGIGTAVWSPGHLHDTELFYAFTEYTMPSAYYRLDLTTGKSSLIRQGKLNFDPASFETKQVFYTSKDGTKVPMFVSYRKGIKLDGSNPTILYGYGGFDIALTPSFSPAIAAWMQMGGVYAVANLRGGSEYGEAWHEAGMKAKKQNVFDDFIAAGQWLIANKYTSTPKLCIFGGSNGGLLVGAVLNQRPDLFGAAMPAVGVMDMLRFQKFGFGTQWTGEYGSADNATDYKTLVAYSPLHTIRKGTKYPPVLITTGDHDDRVMPGHSLKYAATLQQAQEGPAPILIRIDTRAGHGAGKPTSKIIDEWVDRFAFLSAALGMDIG
jgi:prolyl oligopeptidase